MSPRSLRHFLTGPPPPLVSDWSVVAAVLATLLVLAVGQLAPVAIGAFVAAWSQGATPGVAVPPAASMTADDLGAILIPAQILIIVATLGVARLKGPPAVQLRLGPPVEGPRVYTQALAVMVPLLVAFNAVAYAASPAGYAADFAQIRELATGPSAWLLLVAIGIGAPVWEELLFRGFLLPPLAVALGFWPAAILSSAGWAALHLNYSVAGLIEVGLIGLFFAWLFWRTGSVRVPMACHAIYNSALFLGMRWLGV
jgi:membrane protease YdiL (CAAX protease family)